jgi:hypothetical protein
MGQPEAATLGPGPSHAWQGARGDSPRSGLPKGAAHSAVRARLAPVRDAAPRMLAGPCRVMAAGPLGFLG